MRKRTLLILVFILINTQAYAGGVWNSVVNGGNARLGSFTHLKFPSLGQRTHFGVDIPANEGTPIHSMAGGVVHDVVNTGADVNFNSLGYMVIIQHPKLGKNNTDLYSTYLHMQDVPSVNTGDYVHKGDIIGYVGATGAANNTPHTHFEIRYFSGRFSDYNNIYAPSDVRNELYAKNNWEDPENFDIAWDWHGNGSIISSGSGDSTCWGCDRDEARVHPEIVKEGRLPEMQFQWQASDRCREIELYDPSGSTVSENNMVTIFVKPWALDESACSSPQCYEVKTSLPFTISRSFAPANGGYKLIQIKFEIDQPRMKRVIAMCGN